MTRETVLTGNADVIIVAPGSEPVVPRIAGDTLLPVYTAGDVLMAPALAGESVVIVDAGLVGAELGVWLAQMGKNVTLAEATEHILGGPDALPFMNYDMLKDLLHFLQITIHLQTRLTEIDANGVRLLSQDKASAQSADTVIYAVGYRSCNPLYHQLAGCGRETYLLGDARKVGNIMYATWDAYEVARTL